MSGIQLDEDLPFLEREWRIQRFAWVVMLLVTVLGMLGVCGGGPLSHAQRRAAGLSVRYERVIRHGAETELRFQLAATTPSDPYLRLFVSADYLRNFEIRDVVPAPGRSGVAGRFVYFEFLRPASFRTGEVTFHVIPTGYWSQRAMIARAGAGPLRFHQFVLP